MTVPAVGVSVGDGAECEEKIPGQGRAELAGGDVPAGAELWGTGAIVAVTWATVSVTRAAMAVTRLQHL